LWNANLKQDANTSKQIDQSSALINGSNTLVGVSTLDRFHVQQNLLRLVLRGVDGSPSA
jgi:hypothetical protein